MSKVHSDQSAQDTLTKLQDEHFAHLSNTIERIENRSKGVYTIVCKSWNDCKKLIERYKTTKFNDNVPDFVMFAENDPSVKAD